MKARHLFEFWILTMCGWMAAGGSARAEGEWMPLFDGKSLTGWKASENPGTFKVAGGEIVANGSRAHLFYMGGNGRASFKNFEFAAEVKASPGANSGIYFHTVYQEEGWPDQGMEVQINNSAQQHGNYLELKKTGSLYGLRNQYKTVAPDNAWFTLQVAVRGQRIQIRVDHALVVDYLEPDPPLLVKGYEGRRLGRGTFALQGHDPDSRVCFRNIRVRPLPDNLPAEPPAPPVDDSDRQLIELGAANFPLVDFHAHLKGGLTLEEVLTHSRRTGIGYGLVINGGLGFAVTNDAGARRFLESVKGQPVFVGLQGEGREWVTLFSPAAIAEFDYAFTDAMTFTDDAGRRVRLWIKDEVEVRDEQAFMEMYVDRILGVLQREPINIYVNPSYLPEVIAARYDLLWTPDRMRRVIDAAVRRGIAIEINSRFRLPSPAFIKMAKAAGAKFTFGTNNGDRDLGRLEYCLQMARECGLSWQDMWMPKPRTALP